MRQSPFPTPLLDAKLARLRDRNEQDRQRLLRDAIAWLEHHGASYRITSGYVFGSITQPGKFSQHSDLDLAVEDWGGDPFGLSSYLSLHVDRDVDLVPLNHCHFAEKIRQTGVRWIAKT